MPINLKSAALRNQDYRRKAFVAEARSIIEQEREFRRAGHSFNSAKAVSDLLEQIYQLGCNHTDNPETVAADVDEEEDIVDWYAIPQRARNTFMMIMDFGWVVLLAKDSAPWKKNRDQWACYNDLGEHIEGRERFDLVQTYSTSTLAALVKLGLMKIDSLQDNLTMLAPTSKGVRTHLKFKEQD